MFHYLLNFGLTFVVTQKMYIYYMPYLERKQLCYILDQNNKWEELGGFHMKFDVVTMETLRKEPFRGNSSSNELLNLWGHQNHTVLELFILLSRMKHYQAMLVLKKFVHEKYHVLIKEGDDNLNALIRNLDVNGDSRIPVVNFNKSEKILNEYNKYLLPPLSRENNESREENRPILKPKSPLPRAGTSRMYTATDISCVAESAGATPQIPYEELQKSTNNWDSSAVLGKGGFGTVYRGTWKCTQVAIKRLEQKEDKPEYHSEQIKQSITELHCLNAYRHDNILPLYGYSIGGQHPCLVYQYMAGGSLEYRLRTRDQSKVLKWLARLNIAIGVARGLQFLHCSLYGEKPKPLIHGDIKSANILLDPCDQPRIGDFGLAREGPHSNYTHIKVSRIHGTRPYLPDEFLRAKIFSTKVDTYSFGIVLFELATSLGAYSVSRTHKFLKDHVVDYEGDILELKDKRAEEGFDDYFRGLIEIGKQCVNKRAKDRPEMVEALISLEKIFTKENS